MLPPPCLTAEVALKKLHFIWPEKLWFSFIVTILGYLSDHGPSSLIAQFGWATRSTKIVSGYKLLPFENDGQSRASCRSNLRTIDRSRVSVITKSLNTCVNGIFQSLQKPVFSLSLWKILCRMMRGVMDPFWNIKMWETLKTLKPSVRTVNLKICTLWKQKRAR